MLDKFFGHEQEIRRKDIISVQINLLNKCTSRCKSCRKYTWPENEFDVDELIKIISVLKDEFGLQTIFFCGGDPILYKEFPKLIEFLCNNGIKYSLITTLITKDEALLNLIAKTAYRIHVSVDAIDKNIYKIVRGVDGFDIMKNNIEFINKIKGNNKLPIIRFSSTIGKLNYNETYKIYNFAKSNNCLLRFNYLRIWDGLAMTEENETTFYNILKSIVEDENNSKNVISNAKEMLFGEMQKKVFNKCYLHQVSAVIDSNGDLYPCCWIMEEFNYYEKQKERSYGNVKNKNEEQIKAEFNKRFDLQYPQKNGLCENCVEYYCNVLSDLEKIIDNKKEVLFF